MIKKQLCEIGAAFGQFVVVLGILILCFVAFIIILVGNLLAVFGFDGLINKALDTLSRTLTHVYPEEVAVSIMESFRVVE